MGTMGSTLAHELNQPLTAVTNYVRGSRRLLEDADQERIGEVRGALEAAETAALVFGVEVAGIAAVVGVEAGRDVVHAEDHGLGVGAALDHPADERRHGETPFGVHRVQRASVKEVFQLHP